MGVVETLERLADTVGLASESRIAREILALDETQAEDDAAALRGLAAALKEIDPGASRGPAFGASFVTFAPRLAALLTEEE